MTLTLSILVYLFSAVCLRLIINKAIKECPESYKQLKDEHSWFIDVEKIINLLCLLPLLNTAFLLWGTWELLFGNRLT